MTYNQKVWLGILLLCSLFWLALISSIFSLSGGLERAGLQRQNGELVARHGQTYRGNPMLHSVQALTPAPRSPL